MTFEEKIDQFHPEEPGDTSGGIFGLPFNTDEASVIVVPVPWEVTVSYRPGTAQGPKAILEASPQLDLYDEDYADIWKKGIAMAEFPSEMLAENNRMRPLAQLLIEFQEAGGKKEDDSFMESQLETLNKSCADMVKQVRNTTSTYLDNGKKVILLGGDHSTPLGYLQALAQRHNDFGILQIDAHMDLRDSYEGFTYSHASIMYNALKLESVSKIVQVGLRDYAKSELDLHRESKGRLKAHTDRKIRKDLFEEYSWMELCHGIVEDLPDKVYISFDIDGLQPWLCPNTGTPVPGGLQLEEVMYLFDVLKASGREIIGADLVEVAPGQDEWDGNVGARILYRLCGIL